MNYPAHLTFGIGTGLATSVAITNNPILIVGITAMSGLGSLLPDIDTKSKISNKLRVTSFIVRLFTTHRKQTHSLLLNLLFLGVVAYLLNTFVPIDDFTYINHLLFGLFLGICTHLFLDMTTMQGIPIFYPILSKRFALKWFRTGGFGDRLFQGIGILMIVGSLYFYLKGLSF